MRKDRLVSIKNKQYEAIEKWIEDHPEQGYRSVSEVSREALRDWLKNKKLEETHFTVSSQNLIDVP
jgi:Arc/MetJ-type ribon-helix-helix transcriptional regulator